MKRLKDDYKLLNFSKSSCLTTENEIFSRTLILDENIRQKCETFYSKLQSSDDKIEFKCIIDSLLSTNEKSTTQGIVTISTTPIVESSIRCWFTSSTYMEDILGFGISISIDSQRKVTSLLTDGSLISQEAYDSGLRVYPDKSPFDCFLPVWINRSYSMDNNNWITKLKSSLQVIGKQLGCQCLNDAVLRIYPELINTLVVRMMDSSSDRKASEVIFQCILNLWRTFYYLVQVIGGLKPIVVSTYHLRHEYS